MLRAVPKSLFSADYLLERDGMMIGDLRLSRSTTAALVIKRVPVVAFHLHGLDYVLSADVATTSIPFLGKLKKVVLKQEGREIAWAEPSTRFRHFTVCWGSRRIDLKGEFWTWLRKMHIVEGGKEVGSIQRGYFSKRTACMLSGDLPHAVQAFILWLALWRFKSSTPSVD